MKLSTGVFAALTLMLADTGQAQHYKITDLGTLPGGTTSQATAINGRGQVVGLSSVPQGTHAFVWNRSGGMQDLGALPGGGAYSVASGINFGEKVSGSSDFAQPFMGNTHAFVWTKTSGMNDLGTLGCPDLTGASGINAFSEVVGVSSIEPCPGGGQSRAFIAFFSDNTWNMQDLGTLPGGDFSIGTAINFFSHVVGYAGCSPCAYGTSHAFEWSKVAGMKDLGTLPGGNTSIAQGINSFDSVVGFSNLGIGGVLQYAHAVLWEKDGTIIDLGLLPGGSASFALGINDRSEIVGVSSYSNPYSSGEHAFIWTKNDGMRDLNALIPHGSHWNLMGATAINQQGEIVGIGTIDQRTHAFLLTPHGESDRDE